MSDLDQFLALQAGLDEIEREINNYTKIKEGKWGGLGMIIIYLPGGTKAEVRSIH